MYEIEKNVPFPEETRGRKPLYPFREMEVGDSFFVPFSIAASSTVRQSVSRAALANGAKYTTRQLEDGMRVWRTA